MVSAGVAQRPQADPEVVSRLEKEVKRLMEQDQKRQAELDELAKAKDVAGKEITRLQGEFTRLQEVEAE